jgi:hypothetical protein
MSEDVKVETPAPAPVETPAPAPTPVVEKKVKAKKAKAEKKVKEGTRDGHKTYPTYTPGKSCGPGKHEYRKVADKKYARCAKCSSTRTVTEKKA